MGLDIVEFIVGIEEAFDLRIPDAIAETITTPRRLIDHIHGRLPPGGDAPCMSQRAFYTVRRAVADRLGLAAASLRPSTDVWTVLPRRNPQAVWAEVGSSLGQRRWPRVPGDGWFARTFQSGPRTLGDAARHLATFAPAAVKRPGEGWAWREVAGVVDGLMRYHFAVRDYSLDDRFVEDLGFD